MIRTRPTAQDDIRAGLVAYHIDPTAEPATGLVRALARLLITIDRRRAEREATERQDREK